MEIVKLDKKIYAGKKFKAQYITNGYFDIRSFDGTFTFKYVSFKKPIEKSFEDTFFGEWLENPVAYGAFENNELIGYVEGSI